MGFGEFGSNGSVHWKVVHTAEQGVDGYVRGRDSLGSAGPEPQPREFFARLRFETVTEAQQAFNDAIDTYGKVAGAPGTLEVRVPAINRGNPEDLPPWEVKVRW